MLQTGEEHSGVLATIMPSRPSSVCAWDSSFSERCSCGTETSRLDRTLCDDVGPSGGRRLARGKDRDWSSCGLPKPRLEFGSMCGHQQHHLAGSQFQI